MEREDLPDLLAFSVIAQERNFRRAATKLRVSPSALSHSMRRLETKLGAPLLLRTTRSVVPTETGALLLRSLGPALAEIQRGLEEVVERSERIAGLIRINVHRNAAEMLVLRKMRQLRDDNPELRIELSLDDGLVDVVAGGFDAGIRTGEQVAKDMIALRISDDYNTAVVASPYYMEGKAWPATPEDLQQHSLIGYRFVTSQALHRWRFKRGGREVETTFQPCMIVNDVSFLNQAALQGIGLAYVLRESVVDQLRSGMLVELLHEWSIKISGDFLYYPSRRTLSPATRALIEKLRHR